MTRINDDARHFLRTTDKKYDLVVFALIDSLTMQSSFSGVRLESYMFTEESFRAVRERLTPNGLLVVYNYFREPWLVDRLANIAAAAFNAEPRVHVHEARAYLGRDAGRAAPDDADLRSGRARPCHGVQPVARAEPGPRASARHARSSPPPMTGRSCTSRIGTSRRTTSARLRSSSSCPSSR